MYCSKCGNEVRSSDKFCPKCGAKISSYDDRYDYKSRYDYDYNGPTSKDEDKGSLLLGMLLGFCLGIIGVIIATYAIKDEKTRKGTYIGFSINMVTCFIGFSIIFFISFFSMR